MKHGARRVAIQRLLEPARPEKRVDLEGFPVAGVAHGRVVQEHHASHRAQPGQRRFELQRLLDGEAHERLDGLLAPPLERELTEAPGEPLGAGDADSRDLQRRPVEDAHAGPGEDLRHLGGGIGLEVVVAQHGDLRHRDRLQLLGQHARFLGLAAVGEIAAQSEHVRALRDAREQRLEGAGRCPRAVKVADGRDPDGAGHDERIRQGRCQAERSVKSAMLEGQDGEVP